MSYDYEAFGALKLSGSFANDFRFTEEQSDETGLYFLRARYYDPSTGRFISKDPFGGTIGNPASLNRYVYAYDNPTGLTDPSGRFVAALVLIPVGLVLVGIGIEWYAPTQNETDVSGLGAACAAGAGREIEGTVRRWRTAGALIAFGSLALSEAIPAIFYAQREKGMLDQIARDRKLTKDQRQRLGRAVEDYKDEHGIENSRKLPKGVIDKIADDEGLDNRP